MYEEIISGLNLIQIILVFVSLIVLFGLLRTIKIDKLNKRIDKYSFKKVMSSNDISLGDYINILFIKVIKKISLVLSKSKFIIKKANKYKKFIKDENLDYSPIDIISIKTLSSIVLLTLFFVLSGLKNAIVGDFPLLIIIIIGYYLPNIYYFYDYKKRKKEIEKDILTTITILNNLYKAGKSTMQAIEVIANGDNSIAREFKLLYKDLLMGLSIESAFNRLSERTKIKELEYISTTISISETTGGNIVKVFDSIEKTLYSREKIEHEMKTLTANSKITIKALIIMPIVFALGINLLSPNYFNPLFENSIGNVIIIIILLLFSLYIYLVNKILKIRA